MFSGTMFCGPEVLPTINQIDHCFGATHPGGVNNEWIVIVSRPVHSVALFLSSLFSDYLEKEHLFRLKFRGLTFEFKIDPRLEARRFIPIFLIYCWVLIDIVLVNEIFVYGCSLSTNTAWVPCSSQTDLHQLYRACFSTPEIRTKISSQCLTHTIRL